MEPILFGLSYKFWAAVCLGLAVTYAFLWPRPKPGMAERTLFAAVVLRWFHPLVWVLLAAACWLWAGGDTASAGGLAVAALGFYLVYLTMFAVERLRGPR